MTWAWQYELPQLAKLGLSLFFFFVQVACWPLFSPTFLSFSSFSFYAFCFSPTSGILPKLKFFPTPYFGITRRNIKKYIYIIIVLSGSNCMVERADAAFIYIIKRSRKLMIPKKNSKINLILQNTQIWGCDIKAV